MSWTWTTNWLGDLTTIMSYDAGGSYEYNPLYYDDLAAEEEIMKKHCCLYSSNCEVFFSIRPLDNCANYRPPVIR